jgi:hypothetical protein
MRGINTLQGGHSREQKEKASTAHEDEDLEFESCPEKFTSLKT